MPSGALLLAVVLSGIVGSVAYGQCRERGGVLVDLGPPSEFEAVVDISGSERLSGTPRAATGLTIVDVYSPLRQAFADTRELGRSDLEGEVVTATTTSPTVVSPEQARGEDRAFDAYQGPGTYYVGINLSESVYDLGVLVELPMTLRFEVTGAGGAGAVPRGPLEYSAAARPDRQSPREPDPDGPGAGGQPADEQDSGAPVAALAAGGGGGLLAGALLGVGAVALRRRGTTRPSA